MRKRQLFIDKYGEVAGGKLYHALQSQAAHAGVSARLRRKLQTLRRGEARPVVREKRHDLPLFERPAALGLQTDEGTNGVSLCPALDLPAAE